VSFPIWTRKISRRAVIVGRDARLKNKTRYRIHLM
jgi:hypothetical protein